MPVTGRDDVRRILPEVLLMLRRLERVFVPLVEEVEEGLVREGLREREEKEEEGEEEEGEEEGEKGKKKEERKEGEEGGREAGMLTGLPWAAEREREKRLWRLRHDRRRREQQAPQEEQELSLIHS